MNVRHTIGLLICILRSYHESLSVIIVFNSKAIIAASITLRPYVDTVSYDGILLQVYTVFRACTFHNMNMLLWSLGMPPSLAECEIWPIYSYTAECCSTLVGLRAGLSLWRAPCQIYRGGPFVPFPFHYSISWTPFTSYNKLIILFIRSVLNLWSTIYCMKLTVVVMIRGLI